MAQQSTQLSPEQEQRAVDVVTALDWTDCSSVQNALVEALAITKEEADRILGSLAEQDMIRSEANNSLESGSRRFQVKWLRSRIPTTLELVDRLIALEGEVSLTICREMVREAYGCTAEEAGRKLDELRDKGLVVGVTENSTWRLRRAVKAL